MGSPLKPLPRRLFELLEEQQEPFLLDVYLLENGYSKSILKSQAIFMCLKLNTHGFKKMKGGIWRCLLTKLGYWEVIKKALNWDNSSPDNIRLSLFGCFSETRCETRVEGFHHLSSSGAISQGELDGEIGWKDMEPSPVSLLELHSDEGSSVQNHSIEEENPSTSSLISLTEAGSVHFSPLPQYREAKSELHQRRQLLLDFVKEIEEDSCDSCECFSEERVGDVMEEEIFSWEKQRGYVAHIALLDIDLLESRRKWSRFQSEWIEVGIEIEGFIFEEIREECVSDFLGFHCTLERC